MADSPVSVKQGGTGQTVYLNGQLLIGNSSTGGLTLTTLTGTANQVLVGNGIGSITLSLPQNIGVTSNVQFGSVTLPNAGALAISSAVSNIFQINSASGATNRADFVLNRFDLANGYARILFWTGGLGRWSNGMRSGSDNYLIYDDQNLVAQLTMTTGSGTTGTSTFAGSVTVGTNLTVSNGDAVFSTAGKTLNLKTGTNALAGTFTLVSGTATVNTNAIRTGDIVVPSKTASSGTSTAGALLISIVNATSVTFTGNAADNSTFSWFAIHTT